MNRVRLQDDAQSSRKRARPWVQGWEIPASGQMTIGILPILYGGTDSQCEFAPSYEDARLSTDQILLDQLNNRAVLRSSKRIRSERKEWLYGFD